MVNRNISSPFVLDAAMQVPFSIAPNGRVADTSDVGRVWEYRVKTALGTAIGERIFYPGYGIALGDIEFNTQSIAKEIIQREIESAFTSFLEELQLESVDISFSERDSTMNVIVTYYLPDNTLSNATVGVAQISSTAPISEV
jgi:hypothetical protein